MIGTDIDSDVSDIHVPVYSPFPSLHYYRNKLLSCFLIPLSSRFWNRDNEAGTKGPDPLVPGEITGTKGHV